MTGDGCESVYGRWMYAVCYCDPGSYYTEQWPDGSVSAQNCSSSPSSSSENCCKVIGKDVWGAFYPVVSIIELVIFFVIFVWCAVHTFRLYRNRADKIQKLVHVLTCSAILLRLAYIVAETLAVESFRMVAPSSMHNVAAVMAPYLYSSFFPLAASAFLCIYHYWLRFIDALDQAHASQVGQQSSWRSPIYAIPILLGVEVLRDIFCLAGGAMGGGAEEVVQMVNECYFVWFALVDVGVATFGLIVARRLRLRVHAWMPFLGGGALDKVQVCVVTISVTSVLFLILSILQATVGRFCAWPYLILELLGAMLEVIYLSVICAITAHIQQQFRNNNSLELPVGSQFDEWNPSGLSLDTRSIY